jgi:hypothetical protein
MLLINNILNEAAVCPVPGSWRAYRPFPVGVDGNPSLDRQRSHERFVSRQSSTTKRGRASFQHCRHPYKPAGGAEAYRKVDWTQPLNDVQVIEPPIDLFKVGQ